MPDPDAIVAEFQRALDELAARHPGDPAGELTALWHLALERERIVTVAYRRDIVEPRLARMPIDAEVRQVVCAAIRWAWHDEERHALWIRGALLRQGDRWARLRTWRTHLEGAIGGWIASRQAHLRWSEAPVVRSAAEVLEWAGRATGRIPEEVGADLHFQCFADACLFNVGAERTAELAWQRMAELGPVADAELEDIEAYARIADDERRHAAVFDVLARAFDRRDRVARGWSVARLREALGGIGQRFLTEPADDDRAWSNPLGKGGPVVVRQGRSAAALSDTLHAVLDRLDVESLVRGRRVAIKATFMLAVRRADPSPHVSPALLHALCDWLVARGCSVDLIDARNLYDRFHANRTVADVASWLGLTRPDVRVVDAQLDQVAQDYVRGLGQGTICAAWRDAEVRIGVGKLRSHPTTVAMLGLDALEGLAERHDEFSFGRRKVDRAEALMMVLDAWPPHLVLVDAFSDVPDGLLGMMGSGAPRQPRRLYASRDGVAVDAVLARHIGADPGDEPMVLAAAFDWFGDPRRRSLVDGPDTPIPGWQPPSHDVRSALLARLAAPMWHHASAEGALFRPDVDLDAFPALGLPRPGLDAARQVVRRVLAPSLPKHPDDALLQTDLVTIGSREVRMARLGQGPPVVLLHGYPETLQLFSRLAPRLSMHHEVVAPDWPGLGGSVPWSGVPGPAARADQLLAILDHLGLDRVDLVGRDMGGPPALLLAARHPDRVRSVTVMNSLLFDDAPSSWEIGLMRAAGLHSAAFSWAPGAVYRRCLATFLRPSDALTDEVDEDFRAAFRRPSVRRQLAAMCTAYEHEIDALPASYWQVRCPVLCLWAGAGHHFPREHADRLANMIGARVEIIEGAPHWMSWTHATTVAAHLEAFLHEAA